MMKSARQGAIISSWAEQKRSINNMHNDNNKDYLLMEGHWNEANMKAEEERQNHSNSSSNHGQQHRRSTLSPSAAAAATISRPMRSTKFLLLLFWTIYCPALFLSKCAVHAAPVYPELDPRLVDWPLPKREPHERLIRLDCFNELDASFIDDRILFRLGRSQQETAAGRACLVRIPTGSRVTLERLHFASKKSTVTILAGSSPVFLPLRTVDIRASQIDAYGPWHVPCQSAYLVFRPRGTGPEWLEFRLSPETAEDRALERQEDCRAEARNFASEYGPSMEMADQQSSEEGKAEN